MATTAEKRLRLVLPRLVRFVRHPSIPALPWHRLGAGTRIRALPWLELASLLTLAGALFIVFSPALLARTVYVEPDTFSFFFPAFAALHASLHRGELLTWTPNLFSGFPLLAEGQSGVLYPPGALAALLIHPETGFSLLRLFHYGLAAIGAYLLARGLGLQAVPSAITAATFSLGSSLVGHMHHGSLIATASWMPLTLWLVHRAATSAGRAQIRWIAAGGAVFGVQALAAHPQPLLMTGLLALGLAATVTLRPVLVRPRAVRPGTELGTSLRGLVAGGTILVSGAMIGLAQLLPMWELGQESIRASEWTPRQASEYALAPPHLVTLLFPYFFRGPDGQPWSLWQPWEVNLYVGIVPLVLAVLSVLAVRRLEALFFTVVAAVGIGLALADFSPIDLYQLASSLPGLQMQRAPGRFVLMSELALAVLAGFGAQWLSARLASQRTDRARGVTLIILGLIVLVLLLGGCVAVWHSWMLTDPGGARQLLVDPYLALPAEPQMHPSAQTTYLAFLHSLDLSNPKTALPLLLLACLASLLILWREFKRWAAAWQMALLGLVLLDLVIFAVDFHPLAPEHDLRVHTPAAQFLADQAGAQRVYTDPLVRSLQPNYLLPLDVQEARGYSPLALYRYARYSREVGSFPLPLLAAWDVSHLVRVRYEPWLPSYERIGFHPSRPLLAGATGSAFAQETFSVPYEPGDELWVISTIEGGKGFRKLEPVAEWVLTDDAGGRHHSLMLAGRDTASWSAYQEDGGPPYIGEEWVPIRPDDSRAQRAAPVSLWLGRLSLPQHMRVVQAEFRAFPEQGVFRLYGFGLFDRETNQVTQFYPRASRPSVYADQEVVIERLQTAVPRAYVAQTARIFADGDEVLDALAIGDLRPGEVFLEESGTRDPVGAPRQVGAPLPEPAGPSASISQPFTGTWQEATVLERSGDRILLQVDSTGGYLVLTEAWYPGWNATVDGAAAPVLRANYLFRAVPVPSGAHRVELRFQSPTLELGFRLSVLAATLLLLAALVSFIPGRSRLRPA